MVSLRRELVYSLLIAVGLLLVGLVGLLWVSNARERHYQDELDDLHRSLLLRNAEVRQLRRQLQQMAMVPDSSRTGWPNDSVSGFHQPADNQPTTP